MGLRLSKRLQESLLSASGWMSFWMAGRLQALATLRRKMDESGSRPKPSSVSTAGAGACDATATKLGKSSAVPSPLRAALPSCEQMNIQPHLVVIDALLCDNESSALLTGELPKLYSLRLQPAPWEVVV